MENNNSILKEIDYQFAAARKEKKLNQSNLAELVGIHQAEISKLERGIGNPSINTLENIAEALGKTLEIRVVDKNTAKFGNTGLRKAIIDQISYLAEKYSIEQVILFGSRARGDYKEKSDIDLAISGGHKRNFSLDVDDDTYTLLKYDFIDLDSDISFELRNNIQREGIVIYEKI